MSLARLKRFSVGYLQRRRSGIDILGLNICGLEGNAINIDFLAHVKHGTAFVYPRSTAPNGFIGVEEAFARALVHHYRGCVNPINARLGWEVSLPVLRRGY